jgi:hypothetical protein
MHAIDGGATAIKNAIRLLRMEELVDIPRLFTEQNAKGPSGDRRRLPLRDRLVQ